MPTTTQARSPSYQRPGTRASSYGSEPAAVDDAAPEDDARRMALRALGAAVSSGLRRGRFDDVGMAASELVDIYGVARPLDAVCCVLLYQSCCARRWLLGVYRRATARRDLSRAASLARVLARAGALWGCGGDGGDGDDCGFGAGGGDDALGGASGGDLSLAVGRGTIPSGIPKKGKHRLR